MSYIGSTPTSQNFTSGTDYFSGTGSQTTFTLTRTVNSVNDIEVVINNVVQQPSTAYTLSSTTITFTSAPSSGTNNIYVRYLATNMQSFAVPANSITRTQLDSNLQAVAVGRNRIINGAMVISQRNGSTSINPSTTGYPVDRWNCESSSSTVALQQVSDAPSGFTNSIKWTTSTGGTISAGSYMDVFQRIEGYNVADLAYGTADAKTVTVSFWVKSSITGVFAVNLRLESTGWSYVTTYTINSANTWEYKTVTITGSTSIAPASSTNGYGLSLTFVLGVGSTYQTSTLNSWINNGYVGSTTGTNALFTTTGATWQITGVQLEEGTTATSFEREAYSVTLQKCQRYYQVLNTPTANQAVFGTGYYDSTTQAFFSSALPVTMRASPTGGVSAANTFVIQNTANADVGTAVGVRRVAPNLISVYLTTGSARTIGWSCLLQDNNTTSAQITASAEL